MEPWRVDWREKIAPRLSLLGLEGLRKVLVSGEDRLVQRLNFKLEGAQASPVVTMACAIGYATLCEVGAFLPCGYPPCCGIAQKAYRLTCECQPFVIWFDSSSRDFAVTKALLLAEVSRSIAIITETEACETSVASLQPVS